MNPASSFDMECSGTTLPIKKRADESAHSKKCVMECSGTTLPFKKRADESDETTSHLTRLSKNDSQVIGYAHSKRGQPG